MTHDRNSIRELITSRNGIHLTGYINNDKRDLCDLQLQISKVVGLAEKFLKNAMSPEERKQFLGPIEKLADDDTLLSRFHTNIGLFRTARSFRILSLPVPMTSKCIVATTFHVKPLLKWLQSEQDFLLLGIDSTEAHLYIGGQTSLEKLGSMKLSEGTEDQLGTRHCNQRRAGARLIRENIRRLNIWIGRLAPLTQGKLYVAGARDLSEAFLRSRGFKNTYKIPIWSSFSEGQIPLIVGLIRKIDLREGSLRLEKSVFEFTHNQSRRNLVKDLNAIARAATQGRVRKLLVSDEIEIFGSVCDNNGSLKIHGSDLDHEDDDILDDLALSVFSRGGEVYVVHAGPLSEATPILALVDYKEDKSQYC